MLYVFRFGQSLGRWGNFINVEAYGTKTNLPWRMGIIEAGKYIEVHPTFLYESVCTFIIFLILVFKSQNRSFKGELTLSYLILYAFARMLIEGLRTDSLMLGPVRVSQALSFIIFITSILIYIKNRKTQKV